MTKDETGSFKEIIAGISSRDKGERVLSIRAMAILRIPAHSDILSDLLSSPDQEIVFEVIKALGSIANPKSVKYLAEFIESKNSVLFEAAFDALACFPPEQRLQLVPKLAAVNIPAEIRQRFLKLISTSTDLRVAEFAREVLVQGGDPGLLSVAITYFIRHPSPQQHGNLVKYCSSKQWELVLSAFVALSRLKHEAAHAQLLKMTKAPAHNIRIVLAELLNIHPIIEDRDCYKALLKDSHPKVRDLAIKGLTLFAAPERVELFKQIIPEERDEQVLHNLLERAVFEKHKDLYPLFLSLLTSSSAKMKKIGVDGIASIGPVILDRITAEFDKTALVLREQMILAVGEIGGEPAKTLIARCLKANERWLRINSIEAVASMGLKEFMPGFVEMLKSDDLDPWIRATLLSAISRLSDASVANILIDHVRHHDARVRANAIDGLIRLQVPKLKDLLKGVLKDPNDRVRVNAAIGLWELGDSTVLNELYKLLNEPSKWVRASAAFALGEIGSGEAVPALLELLEDSADVVYRNTIGALVKIGDSRSLLPLLKEREKLRLSDSTFSEMLASYINKLHE